MGETRILENEELLVEINDLGAELARIYDKKAGREVIWDANTKYWDRHAPVLFPFVGVLEGKTYHYKGKSYEMGPHGFARDCEFVMLEQDGSHVSHKLTWSEESLEKYPFRFSLIITHTLNGREIKVGWKVVNEQEEDMYFSIGAHPAFRVPAEGIGEGKDYFLNLYTSGKEDSKKTFTCLRINGEGTVLVDSPQDFPTEEGFRQIEEDLFNDGVWIFEDGQLPKVGLAYPDKTPYIEIQCEGFPYVGIWTKPEAPFVCLEPWFGRADDTGFTGELKDKKGIMKLEGGKVFQASYDIKIFE